MTDNSNPLDITPYVFVYGTLKKGHGNWRWALSDEEYIGSRTTVEDFILGCIGFPFAFPRGLFEDETVVEQLYKPVRGDLFKVSGEETMVKLDRLEGEGSMYHRILTELKCGTRAWMYQCLRPQTINQLYACDQTDEGEWVWNP